MARHLLAVTLALACAWGHLSSGAQAAAPAPACGAPGGPCGASLPKGSPCAANAGFCQAGSYCGNADGKVTTSKCMPLLKGAGTKAADPNAPWNVTPSAATFCLPPNAKRPFTSDPSLDLQPSCAAPGLTCKFFTAGPWRTSPEDSLAANVPPGERFGDCLAIPKDCGQPGKTCCPNPYHTRYNPKPPGYMCWGSLEFSNASYCQYNPNGGTCVPNAKGCGKPGSPCCIHDYGVTTDYICGTNGKRDGHYCTRTTKDKPVAMCQVCPKDWQARLKAGQQELYMCGPAHRRRRALFSWWRA